MTIPPYFEDSPMEQLNPSLPLDNSLPPLPRYSFPGPPVMPPGLRSVYPDNPLSRPVNDCPIKPTNPKDLVGSDKVPLHLWPPAATVLGALGLLEGALKYGRSNWRVVGVRASIYYDAALRHLQAWMEGEDLDPDSGIPHLGHALACLAILVDAEAAGMLTDDRSYPGGYRESIKALTPEVKRVKDQYANLSPKHYTIQDKETT